MKLIFVYQKGLYKLPCSMTSHLEKLMQRKSSVANLWVPSTYHYANWKLKRTEQQINLKRPRLHRMRPLNVWIMCLRPKRGPRTQKPWATYTSRITEMCNFEICLKWLSPPASLNILAPPWNIYVHTMYHNLFWLSTYQHNWESHL